MVYNLFRKYDSGLFIPVPDFLHIPDPGDKKANTAYKDGLNWALTTLEEGRHKADMVQTYKIVTGKDMVNSNNMVYISHSDIIRKANPQCSRGHKHPGWRSEGNFSHKEWQRAGT